MCTCDVTGSIRSEVSVGCGCRRKEETNICGVVCVVWDSTTSSYEKGERNGHAPDTAPAPAALSPLEHSRHCPLDALPILEPDLATSHNLHPFRSLAISLAIPSLAIIALFIPIPNRTQTPITLPRKHLVHARLPLPQCLPNNIPPRLNHPPDLAQCMLRRPQLRERIARCRALRQPQPVEQRVPQFRGECRVLGGASPLPEHAHQPAPRASFQDTLRMSSSIAKCNTRAAH
ncbi:hypothetical protein CVT25_009289 [Psilocybe cyanescens]|uniref:Uncharacterized protein n=1 Tax=Psilocybe cyanescens TaxID=93625 RepID=A0A409WW98_PSICY|nr:hypothetical protein CVT25_009289 [Psilocybe cyanescens]